ncbi:hypothetical protein EGW08_020892 [Elysia chlorotica]|uniref:Endonuclease/exonuclease/phosphatase domain-containing protein n=1 Tax=Elysia chlorotica TaxID=188477 RepID=A0A3S0ZN79_ELYCH|nr:hypothetical protein EGW08_020892 [Elysia chlorotica]
MLHQTKEHSDDEIEKFYEELDNVKNNLKTQDVKIVMGDFNAKVGNKRIEDTICPHGIEDFCITCECIGIQTYSNCSNSKYFHDKIKDVAGRKPSPKSSCIKSQSGQFLVDIDDILKKWSQYAEELFDDPRPPIRNNKGPPIMEEEVRNAIRKMKHNKATGPDEIPVELFDALNETCLIHFTKLLNLIYDTGQWPSDWKKNQYL